ncbi:Copia protein, partial [Mucuna pruriens]
MSDLGLLSYFLRIEYKMTKYKIVMHQSNYASIQVCKGSIDGGGGLNMQQSNLSGTPVEVGLVLEKETNEKLVDHTYYRKISHLLATKRILRYVQGKVDFGILFPKGEADAKLKLIGYSDLDWCEDKRYIFYEGAPISWSFTKKPIATLSSCETEYITAFETACQVVWLDALTKELQVKNSSKVKLLIDKKSTIDLARHTSHERSKAYRNKVPLLKIASQQ